MKCKLLFTFCIFLMGNLSLRASDALSPGTLSTYSTIYSIGMEWNISGDDNHNAVSILKYRSYGSSLPYNTCLPLYRVDYNGYNMLAGSILFLTAGTTYEVEITISDPDGGDSTIVQVISTLPIPQLPAAGDTFYVEPGSGGGTGTMSDPFKGLATAEAVAGAGDIILLANGNYGQNYLFTKSGLSENHIVYKAIEAGGAIFEGIRIACDHIWLEGIKIIDQYYGLRTSPPGPTGIVIRRCLFDNNHYSIFLNDGGQQWYIVDNTIIGDNNLDGSDFSGEGIELQHTSGHTIAYNTISRVADGISYPHRNVDMFANDIFDTTDDGIEFDYGHNNNRAWHNRITNVYNNGISFQPMEGSPAYVLYNQVSVLNGQSVLKLRDPCDRVLIAHNTFIINSGPMAFGSHLLAHMESKNNLWISINDRYAWESGQVVGTNWKTSWDYDGFDWGNYIYAFKWDNQRLDNIMSLTNLTGQEANAIRIDHNTCFENLNYSTLSGSTEVDSFYIEYNTLTENCNAIDAGIILPGINEHYIGQAPDLGAYEKGALLPHYGVRTYCDQTTINERIGNLTGHWYDSVSNWSQNRFPESCDRVIIPTGFHISIHDGQIARAYQLQLSGQLTLMGNGALLLEVTE